MVMNHVESLMVSGFMGRGRGAPVDYNRPQHNFMPHMMAPRFPPPGAPGGYPYAPPPFVPPPPSDDRDRRDKDKRKRSVSPDRSRGSRKTERYESDDSDHERRSKKG